MSRTSSDAVRMPLLMPDDFSELHLVGWRVEPGQPDPDNPLIEGEMPWDRGGVGIHGSVFRDPLDGPFRLRANWGGLRPEDAKLFALYVTEGT